MVDFLDFFYKYILGSMELLIMFHFFLRFLGKNTNPIHYLIFNIMGILIFIISPESSIIQFCGSVLLLIIEGIYICRSNAAFVILYAVITTEIMRLCYGIFGSLSFILSPMLFPINPKLISIVFMIDGSSMALLLSIFCYYIVKRYFRYGEIAQSQYILMILIPVVMIALVDTYISSTIYGNTIIMENNGAILNTNHYQMFIIQLLGIASLFCIMYAYRKSLEGFQLHIELSLLEQKNNCLYQYVEEAKVRYEKTVSFRHDIKNHIKVVKELLQKNQLEQALNYMKEMESITTNLSFPCNTNNPVLDILLGNKLGIAKNNHINISCLLYLPYPCSISDIDFCIILSNALDNAIDACKTLDNTKKYIRVTGNMQGDFILLEIQNSIEGNFILQEGIGLKNIRAVAEKYNGTMNIKIQEKEFSLSILLIIPQQIEHISQQDD